MHTLSFPCQFISSLFYNYFVSNNAGLLRLTLAVSRRTVLVKGHIEILQL